MDCDEVKGVFPLLPKHLIAQAEGRAMNRRKKFLCWSTEQTTNCASNSGPDATDIVQRWEELANRSVVGGADSTIESKT